MGCIDLIYFHFFPMLSIRYLVTMCVAVAMISVAYGRSSFEPGVEAVRGRRGQKGMNLTERRHRLNSRPSLRICVGSRRTVLDARRASTRRR